MWQCQRLLLAESMFLCGMSLHFTIERSVLEAYGKVMCNSWFVVSVEGTVCFELNWRGRFPLMV